MSDDNSPSAAPTNEADLARARLREAAANPQASKPSGVSESEWRKHRVAAGQMVIIRSHFKSIYLIPMTIISLVCALILVWKAGDSGEAPQEWRDALGLVWAISFCFYMNIFIFEWSRAWTVALVLFLGLLVAVGFAVDSDSFPVWKSVGDFFRGLHLQFSSGMGFFFGIFFGICALISIIKTRVNYVVIERNEIQVYRNALFGDRQRLPMMNRRMMVRVPDMIEYFHPGYGAGQIIIVAQGHAGEKDLVLDNVRNIRRIERAMDNLGGAFVVVGGAPAAAPPPQA